MSVYIIKRCPNNNWCIEDNNIYKDFPSLINVGNNIIDNTSLAKLLERFHAKCFNSENQYSNLLYALNNNNNLIIIGLSKINDVIASGEIFINTSDTNTYKDTSMEYEKRYFIYNLCKYDETGKKQKNSPVKILMDKFKEIVIKDMKNKTIYLTVDMKAPLSALILTRLYINKYKFRLDEYKDMYSGM